MTGTEPLKYIAMLHCGVYTGLLVINEEASNWDSGSSF